jgi:hypothetical protein
MIGADKLFQPSHSGHSDKVRHQTPFRVARIEDPHLIRNSAPVAVTNSARDCVAARYSGRRQCFCGVRLGLSLLHICNAVFSRSRELVVIAISASQFFRQVLQYLNRYLATLAAPRHTAPKIQSFPCISSAGSWALVSSACSSPETDQNCARNRRVVAFDQVAAKSFRSFGTAVPRVSSYRSGTLRVHFVENRKAPYRLARMLGKW